MTLRLVSQLKMFYLYKTIPPAYETIYLYTNLCIAAVRDDQRRFFFAERFYICSQKKI